MRAYTRISVIVPVYNVQKYLDICLESIVNQTFREIEIICINNGASVKESDILSRFASLDSRIKIIRFEENQGYGKAINTGIGLAKGEYISIIESDDYIDTQMMEKLYYQACDIRPDIIKSCYTEFSGRIERKYLDNLGIPPHTLFKLTDYPEILTRHPSIWSCLYLKEFLINNHILFIERKGSSWVDNAFQLKSLYMAKKILFTYDSFYHYRIHETSSSSLKNDVLIPFECIKDMNTVVDELKIVDRNILKSLKTRYLDYIEITLNKSTISDAQNITVPINTIFNMIGNDLSDEPRFKKLYKKYYQKSFNVFLRCLSNSRKKIISVRFNRNEKSISIFNNYIYISKRHK